MRAYIGPYKNWIGPYQIADKLKIFGVSEEKADAIGEWLSNTWLDKACNWIYNKKRRRVFVYINDYDVWNTDHTLALIILPVLRKLQEVKHGSPMSEPEDVPEEFRDKDVHERWDWILSEIIWAFEQIVDDSDDHLMDKEFQDRIDRGLMLFGKFYRGLWD